MGAITTAQISAATFGVLVALVKVLHKSKAIHIDDLLAEIGAPIDYARMQHISAPGDHAASQILYDQLQALAKALAHSESKPPE